MSTGTLATRRDATSVSSLETVVSVARDSIPVDVSAERSLTDTDQLSHTLRRLATDLGLAPAEHGDSSAGTSRQTWVEIAPGVIVRAERREERFASVALEPLRKKMRPAAFAAFVKHIGIVPGREDLDVAEISRIPDDR